MKKGPSNLILISFLVLGVVLVALLLYQGTPFKAEAGETDNVSGFAWSDTLGWISFNSTSDGSSHDYGVNIADDGTLSGYGWSDNAGWISFNESDLSGCPSSPCTAEFNFDTGGLEGWAKVLSYNGWMSLDGSNYGVSLNESTGEFEGWAWEDIGLGWVSFNCNNENECSDSSYRVSTTFSPNRAPSVSNLNVEHANYCSTPSESFSWDFSDPDGDKQGAYRIQIDKRGTFDNFETDEYDSGKVYSSTESKLVPVAKDPGESDIAYDTGYYWRIKVWDEEDVSSDWVEGSSFATEPHIYPDPDFSWSPETVTKGEEVQFCSTEDEEEGCSQESVCYDSDNNQVSCSGESFLWDFPEGAEFSTSTDSSSENPEVKFQESGNISVSLEITDDVGSCSKPKNIRINIDLPKWKEIEP